MKREKKDILYNIVEIRNRKGFTQDYLARKLGLKQAGYGLIERGERKLDYELLLQIAIIFEMDIIDIITYPDKYYKESEQNFTKVLVELHVNSYEFIKLGLKDKVLQILNK